MSVKQLLRMLGLLACLLVFGAAASENGGYYPSRPISIVVTFPPGGGTDMLARQLAKRMEAALGVPVVVENKPGASGNIGAKVVAASKPDGYTLLMVNSSFAINPGVYTNLGFSPTDDFEPVFNVAWVPSLVVTALPDKFPDLDSVFRAARGDLLPVASCGNGTPQHLAIQMMHEGADAALQHIPYRGCGPALNDVAAGIVPVGVVTLSSAMSFVQSGMLHALAVTAEQRSPLQPNVPTVAEHGLQGYSLNQWHGLLAPAGVPGTVLDHLADALHTIVQSDDMQTVLQESGYAPASQSRREFSELVGTDIDRFRRLTARMGLRVD